MPKKRSSPKTRTRTVTKYRTRTVKAARRYGKRAKGILGGLGAHLGIKEIAFGAGGLLVASKYQPFGGAYKPAIDKIAIGLAGPMVGMGNQDMLSVGVKEAIATAANGYLGFSPGYEAGWL